MSIKRIKFIEIHKIDQYSLINYMRNLSFLIFLLLFHIQFLNTFEFSCFICQCFLIRFNKITIKDIPDPYVSEFRLVGIVFLHALHSLLFCMAFQIYFIENISLKYALGFYQILPFRICLGIRIKCMKQ